MNYGRNNTSNRRRKIQSRVLSKKKKVKQQRTENRQNQSAPLSDKTGIEHQKDANPEKEQQPADTWLKQQVHHAKTRNSAALQFDRITGNCKK